MQLKSLAQTKEALYDLNNIGNLNEIGQKYSNNVLKSAIVQSSLNNEQIEAVLSANGMRGALLQTTTDELANAASVNEVAAAQEAAAASTIGFSTALKGLSIKLKSLVSAHPALLALSAGITAVAAAFKLADYFTVSLEEQKEALEDAKNEYQNVASELENLNSEISQTLSRIQQLQNKADNCEITLVEIEELNRLKQVNKELELQAKNQEILLEDKAKKASDEAYKTYIKENRIDYGSTSNQEKIYNAAYDMDGFHVGVFTSSASEISDYDYAIKKNEQKIQEYNEKNQNLNELLNNTSDDDLVIEYQADIEYNDKLLDNLTESNEKLKESAKEKAEEIFSDKIEEYDDYKNILLNSMNSDGTFDDENLQNMWDDIQQKTKDLYKYSGKADEWNTIEFNAVIQDSSLNSTMTQIQDMLNAGNLTAVDIQGFTDLNDKLQDTNLILEDGQNASDLFINYLNELKNTGEILSASFDLSYLLTESDNKKTSSATLADLQSEADTLASIKREMSETGKIGVSSMQSITSQFPEANQELSKYMSGLISEQELFSSLTGIYEQDTKQYLQALVNKNSADAAFFSKVLSNNNVLFSELSNAYGFDIQNWTTLAKAKADIESNLIKQLTGVWTGYYSATKDSLTGLYTLTVNEEYDVYDDSDLITPEMEADRVKQLEEYEKYNKIIQSLNDASAAIVAPNFDLTWDALSGFDEDSFSSQAEAFSEEINWIERAVNKVSSAYERLKNIVSDTTKNWLSRNSALENSFSVLEDEINTQQQVYRKYTDMFNSYDLDSHYKELISNGTIEIETITDESLKNAIDECIDLYDNAREAKDAVDELTQEYRSLAMTRFDNLKSEYEAQIGLIEDTVGILEAQLSLLETDGYINSKYLYNSLIEAEKENLQNLNAEYAALSSKINTVEEGSENWYSMKTDINSVSEAIINATDSLKGYENELRQIEWDLFDRTRDDVADLIDESDFLYGILEDKGFYDDGGNLNRYGQAAQAMLAQKYELYASQSKAYADEVKKIDEELAKDPYSIDLIDRRQELIKLQQESVQSALDEKNALKDLISDGYEEYKNSLDDIISKYKDLLSTIKDTYDYEKNISELTDNLAALEKQYQAYQGDNSESGRKNVRQLKAELDEARQDLKETEYEKLISDTEKLLDEFQTDVDEWLNERLDHLDVLISDVISQSNTNTEAIACTINEAADSVGYTLSDNMNGIWAVYSGNITNALSEIGNEFTSGQSALHDTVKNIGDSVLELLKYADEEAAGLIAEQGSQADGGSDTVSQAEYETNTWENPASGGGNAGGDAGSSDWAIYKYYYPQDLNVDTSVVDRLKSHNIDASFEARSRYWDMLIGDGEYYSTYEQNVRLLNWLKDNRYAKGSRRILFDQLGLTQERGQELIFSKTLGGMITPLRRGDKVFTSEMTENLWKLAQKPVVPDFNLGDTQLPYIGQQNMSNDVNVSFGDVSVTLPNVKNYSDFMREAQKDPDFTKMVQNIALGKAFGKNTYDRYVY